MSDQRHPDTHPGVITLPQAYRERIPCPLCAPGHPSCVHTPLGEANLAQERIA